METHIGQDGGDAPYIFCDLTTEPPTTTYFESSLAKQGMVYLMLVGSRAYLFVPRSLAKAHVAEMQTGKQANLLCAAKREGWAIEFDDGSPHTFQVFTELANVFYTAPTITPGTLQVIVEDGEHWSLPARIRGGVVFPSEA